MSDTITPIIDLNDPLLGVAAGDVPEMTYPILRDCTARFIVREFKVTQDEATKARRANVRIALAGDKDTTGNDLTDTAGNRVGAGFSFSETIFLDPGQYSTPEKVKGECAQFVRAILGKGTTTSFAQVAANPSLIIDKPVDVKVGNRTNKKNGNVNNVVKSWVVA